MDILVNCVGISQTTLLKRTSDEALASIIDTNLLATMLVCKHARVRQNGIRPALNVQFFLKKEEHEVADEHRHNRVHHQCL